jgi:putative hemolysin
MGGFVITHLGKIPVAAEHFDWNGLRVEVVDMDGNRVDKILVMPIDSAGDRSTSNPKN